MAISDDIQTLVDIQDDLFATHGRYIQGLATPSEIPTEGDNAEVTALSMPNDESVVIEFTPTAQDYQFTIDVWEKNGLSGYTITAKQYMTSGLLSTITRAISES